MKSFKKTAPSLTTATPSLTSPSEEGEGFRKHIAKRTDIPARFLVAAVLAASLLTQTAHAASNPPPPPINARRDPPPGTSEADIRRYCTRKYDAEVALIPDSAGGAGGMLTGPAMEEWRRCMRRNGVEP